MGIKSFYKFIEDNFSKCIKYTNVNNKTYLVDGLQKMYKQLIYMNEKKTIMYNKKNKNVTHINIMCSSLLNYLKKNTIPIFIFDGKSPLIKKDALNKKKRIFSNNLNKLSILKKDGNNEMTKQYEKLCKKTITIKNYFITDWLKIARLMGLHAFRAKEEADLLCAHIIKNNSFISGVISDDSDMLIFGSHTIIKKDKEGNFISINLNKLIKLINTKLNENKEYELMGKIFDVENLIEFAILCGSDYEKFELKIHIKNKYELLQFMMMNNVNDLVHDKDLHKFNEIKTYYMKQHSSSEENLYHVQNEWKQPNYTELKIAFEKLHMDDKYIEETLNSLKTCHENHINLKIYESHKSKTLTTAKTTIQKAPDIPILDIPVEPVVFKIKKLNKISESWIDLKQSKLKWDDETNTYI